MLNSTKYQNPDSSSQIAKTLKKLGELRDNVDNTILRTIEFFIPNLYSQPETFPLKDGGLQFEYERKDGAYLEFEFHNDNTVKMFFTDFIHYEQDELIDCDIDMINNLTRNFFKNTKCPYENASIKILKRS